MPTRIAKPIKDFTSSTVVVQVGGGPSLLQICTTQHTYPFLSCTMWSRSSGVNRAKKVVVGSPKVMDGSTGSKNSRMFTVQGVSDHSVSSSLVSKLTPYPPQAPCV